MASSISEKSLLVVAKAMAIADEMESHPFPSFSSQLEEVKQGPVDDLSLEDIVWADSCLKDPDASQIDWNSWDAFGLALSETFSCETDSPAARIENRPEGAVIEISPSNQQIGTAKILGTRVDGDSSITQRADENSDDQLINGQTDNFHSEINLENVFRPTWNENSEDQLINVQTDNFHSEINLENVFLPTWNENFSAPDTEVGVDFPGFVMEQSTRDIFKVWDLGLPAEEDEFITQLNRAFAQSSLEPSIAIDDIIFGMSGLSLNRFPM